MTLIEMMIVLGLLALIGVGATHLYRNSVRAEAAIAAREAAEGDVSQIIIEAKKAVERRKYAPSAASLAAKPYLNLSSCVGDFCRRLDTTRIKVGTDPVTGVRTETEEPVSIDSMCKKIPAGAVQGAPAAAPANDCGLACPKGEVPVVEIVAGPTRRVYPNIGGATRQRMTWGASICIGRPAAALRMKDSLDLNVTAEYLVEDGKTNPVSRRVAVPLAKTTGSHIELMH